MKNIELAYYFHKKCDEISVDLVDSKKKIAHEYEPAPLQNLIHR